MVYYFFSKLWEIRKVVILLLYVFYLKLIGDEIGLEILMDVINYLIFDYRRNLGMFLNIN